MTQEELNEILRRHTRWIEGGMKDWSDPDRARLVSARLVGANLWDAKGIICLPVGDSRGYRPVAVWQGDLWKIAAGCRWFTIKGARAHYARPESASGSRALAEMYLAAIDWLEQQPTPKEHDA